MKETVLDIFEVKAALKCRGVKYVLPWRRHAGYQGNKWMAAGAVLVCAAAVLMPLLFWQFMKPKPWSLGAIFFGVWAGFWCSLSIGFTALFMAMTWSMWTRWGRAWIWVSRATIVTAQLRGDESMISVTSLAQVKRFSTLPDGDDPKNPATPARLLAELDNNVKRLLGDYPIALVDAMVKELTVTTRRLRR